METKYSKTEKQRHIAAWRESGLSKVGYAKAQKIAPGTFYSWCSGVGNTEKSDNLSFIPTKLVSASGALTVTLPGGLIVSCQINQLYDVVQALQSC